MRIILSLAILCILAACKDDNCEQPPISFTVEEQVGDRWFPGDTIGRLKPLRFRATVDGVGYSWNIQGQTFNAGSILYLNWLLPNVGGTNEVDITLNKAADCGDDLSTTRPVYIWPQPEFGNFNGSGVPLIQANYFLIYGTYRGATLDNPNDVYSITIFDTTEVALVNYKQVIRGFPYKNTNASLYHALNYNLSFFDDASPKAVQLNTIGYQEQGLPTIPRFEGYAYLDRQDPNKIILEYRYQDTLTGNWVDKVFHGDKIH